MAANRYSSLFIFAISVLLISAFVHAEDAKPLKFSFGAGKSEAGFTKVSANAMYNDKDGFGFESAGGLKDLESGGGHAVVGGKAFYFSVRLPKEGNYNVTLTLGDPSGASDTTVKAELRRLMLEGVKPADGKFETRIITVNTRTPAISGGGAVRLKDREKTSEAWDWDDKLTLEFNGPHPSVSAVEIVAAPEVPTVFILGDSTVCDQPAEPWNSWGQMLPRFFKPGVAVANHAESGESLRSSLGAHRLDKVLSVMKPGDYLFIQYGHNDMKEKGEGIGAFTSYKKDLEHFVAEARKKGGVPVVVTPMHRKSLGADGKVTNTLGDYPKAARQVAREQGVSLIDLNAMSAVFYEALGAKDISKAFVDGTHHNNYGSYELAKCVRLGIRAGRLPLADRMIDWFEFDPGHPDSVDDFKMAVSPRVSGAKPLGN